MDIRDNRKNGSSLTWSEVINMPYTAKVSSISIVFVLILRFTRIFNQVLIYSILPILGNQRNPSYNHNLTLVFKKSCTGLSD